MLANDVTLRNLVPDELAKGFGFFQRKPATAFSPFAVTPDELGGAWRDGRVHLRLRIDATTAQLVGDVDAGPEMHFSFFDLIAHIARTRRFTRRHDPRQRHGVQRRSARAASPASPSGAHDRDHRERQAADAVHEAAGDTVAIEMLDESGRSSSGRIAAERWLGGMKLYDYWRSSSAWRVRIALALEGRRLRDGRR